ncbi:MAG: hypothetical protein V4444_09520 [Pseudomonadota bacterium]
MTDVTELLRDGVLPLSAHSGTLWNGRTVSWYPVVCSFECRFRPLPASAVAAGVNLIYLGLNFGCEGTFWRVSGIKDQDRDRLHRRRPPNIFGKRQLIDPNTIPTHFAASKRE